MKDLASYYFTMHSHVTSLLSSWYSDLYGPSIKLYVDIYRTGTICNKQHARNINYRSPLLLTTLILGTTLQGLYQWEMLLSGVPDYFDRNKILSGYDLSHYQVPHCIRVFFDFVWFVFIHYNFQFYFKLYVPIVTFWIFTYHKIWILLIIVCFIWSYWIIYFLTCLEVFWSVVS